MRRTLSICLLAGALAAGPAPAAGEAVPLYTNADLPPVPPGAPGPDRAAPAAGGTGDGWATVLAFIERERQRIEADRHERLECRRLEALEAAATPVVDRLLWPGHFPLFRLPGGPPASATPAPFGPHGHRHGAPPRLGTLHHGPGRAPDIVPLHARPSPGLAHRARVLHRQRQATQPHPHE